MCLRTRSIRLVVVSIAFADRHQSLELPNFFSTLNTFIASVVHRTPERRGHLLL